MWKVIVEIMLTFKHKTKSINLFIDIIDDNEPQTLNTTIRM